MLIEALLAEVLSGTKNNTNFGGMSSADAARRCRGCANRGYGCNGSDGPCGSYISKTAQDLERINAQWKHR